MDFFQPVKHYLESILMIEDVQLHDAPRLAVRLDPKAKQLMRIGGKYQMFLPLSRKTQRRLFGNEVVEHMSDQLWWGILIGGLYHELGHILSGEPVYSEPMLNTLANIINDANENNVIPRHWFGSIVFINILNRFVTALSSDFSACESQDIAEQLEWLFQAANTYRVNLYLPIDGKQVQSLPKTHELYSIMEELKVIMEQARREDSSSKRALFKKRDSLVRQMEAALKKWLAHSEPKKDDRGAKNSPDGSGQGAPEGAESTPGSAGGGEGEPESDESAGKSPTLEELCSKADPQDTEGQLLPNGGVEASPELLEALRNMDQELAPELGNTLAEITEDLKYEAAEREQQEEKQELEKIDRLDVTGLNKQLIESWSAGHSDTGGDNPDYFGPKAVPDQSIVHELRHIFKRMIFKRTYTGRHIDIIGQRLHAPNFYQIKTVKEPRLMRTIGKMKVDAVTTDVVFMFDRSASMSARNNAGLCATVMATFYEALKSINQIKLTLLSFNTRVHMIRTDRDVFANIARGLNPRGGTAFRVAERSALYILERSSAQKKILIMLTDGDTDGNRGYSLKGLQLVAKKNNIITIVITVDAVMPMRLRKYFDGNINIRDCRPLLSEMRKIARQHF